MLKKALRCCLGFWGELFLKWDMDNCSFCYDFIWFRCIITSHNFVTSKNLHCHRVSKATLQYLLPSLAHQSRFKGSNSMQVVGFSAASGILANHGTHRMSPLQETDWPGWPVLTEIPPGMGSDGSQQTTVSGAGSATSPIFYYYC